MDKQKFIFRADILTCNSGKSTGAPNNITITCTTTITTTSASTTATATSDHTESKHYDCTMFDC